ncbi:MAG: phosphatidylglycerophosphatase A [Rudaea sp.]
MTREAPMRVPAPTLSFLLSHPAHFVALGGGAGLSPVATGTTGTLVAFPIAWLLDAYAGTQGFFIAIVAITALGVAATHVTARDLGVADHGSIVIDEIAAFLLVLFFAGTDAVRQALAFVLFRVFDVVKPPPIRQVDARMHNAFGVMADDFLAAGYTLLTLALVHRLFGI